MRREWPATPGVGVEGSGTSEDTDPETTHLVGFPYIRWWHGDFLSDPRVRRLDATMRGVYISLLSLAAQQAMPGTLMDMDGEPLDVHTIAADTGLRVEVVERFVALALERDLLAHFDDNGTLCFPAFPKRQITRKQLEVSEQKRERASEHGKKGAKGRWHPEKNGSEPAE